MYSRVFRCLSPQMILARVRNSFMVYKKCNKPLLFGYGWVGTIIFLVASVCPTALVAFMLKRTLLLLMWCVALSSSAKFTLLLSMPNSSTAISVRRIGAGALIAIDTVNNRPDLLPGQTTLNPHRGQY